MGVRNDCIMQVRIDSLTLATVAKFVYDSGVPFENASALGRRVFKEFAKIIIDSGGKDITDFEEALEVIRGLGLNVNASDRGMYSRTLNLTGAKTYQCKQEPVTGRLRGADMRTEDLVEAVRDHWRSTGQTPPDEAERVKSALGQPASPQTEPTYTQAELRASLEKQDQDLEQLKALDDVSLAPMVERETVK